MEIFLSVDYKFDVKVIISRMVDPNSIYVFYNAYRVTEFASGKNVMKS